VQLQRHQVEDHRPAAENQREQRQVPPADQGGSEEEHDPPHHEQQGALIQLPRQEECSFIRISLAEAGLPHIRLRGHGAGERPC
jgi:hypothetical protein